mmetsp:Transcript_12607/g.35170  ORF Transcript_12607/g.35170 Transcript_12607/m.35170 type:complete len:212 (-) Transcript_12607:472-1107(-)
MCSLAWWRAALLPSSSTTVSCSFASTAFLASTSFSFSFSKFSALFMVSCSSNCKSCIFSEDVFWSASSFASSLSFRTVVSSFSSSATLFAKNSFVAVSEARNAFRPSSSLELTLGLAVPWSWLLPLKDGGPWESETSDALDVEFTEPDLDALLLLVKKPAKPDCPPLLCSLIAWSTCRNAVKGGLQLSWSSAVSKPTHWSRASLLAPITSL